MLVNHADVSKARMNKSYTAKDTVAPMTSLLKTMKDISLKSVPSQGRDWLEPRTSVGNDMLSFTADRIKKDVQMQRDLMHAKGIANTQHAQTQFFQNAMNGYAAETAKLMTMGKPLSFGANPKKPT